MAELVKVAGSSCSYPGSFSVIVEDDGSILVSGNNSEGYVGLGYESRNRGYDSDGGHESDQKVTNLPEIVSAGCGNQFFAAATADGDLLTWGDGTRGNLGHDSTESLTKPRKVEGLTGHFVKKVACGNHHVLVLCGDGSVWSWGYNDCGEIGRGHKHVVKEPRKMELNGIEVVNIACGHQFSALVTVDGSLLMFGDNSSGQLGLGHNDQVLVPTKVTALQDYDVVEVSCGREHTVAICSNGSIFAWGNNDYGQLALYDRRNKTVPTLVEGLEDENVTSVVCRDDETRFFSSPPSIKAVCVPTPRN